MSDDEDDAGGDPEMKQLQQMGLVLLQRNNELEDESTQLREAVDELRSRCAASIADLENAENANHDLDEQNAGLQRELRVWRMSPQHTAELQSELTTARQAQKVDKDRIDELEAANSGFSRIRDMKRAVEEAETGTHVYSPFSLFALNSLPALN